MCLAQKTCSSSVLHPVVTSLGTEVPSSAFCQRWVDSLCSEKTFHHSSKHSLWMPDQEVVRWDGCTSVCFKSRQVAQSEATVNPMEGLFLCTGPEDLCCLCLQGLLEQVLAARDHCTQTPNQARALWSVCGPVPRTYIFCCLFSGSSFPVSMPNLLINKGGSPAHTRIPH